MPCCPWCLRESEATLPPPGLGLCRVSSGSGALIPHPAARLPAQAGYQSAVFGPQAGSMCWCLAFWWAGSGALGSLPFSAPGQLRGLGLSFLQCLGGMRHPRLAWVCVFPVAVVVLGVWALQAAAEAHSSQGLCLQAEEEPHPRRSSSPAARGEAWAVAALSVQRPVLCRSRRELWARGRMCRWGPGEESGAPGPGECGGWERGQACEQTEGSRAEWWVARWREAGRLAGAQGGSGTRAAGWAGPCHMGPQRPCRALSSTPSEVGAMGSFGSVLSQQRGDWVGGAETLGAREKGCQGVCLAGAGVRPQEGGGPCAGLCRPGGNSPPACGCRGRKGLVELPHPGRHGGSSWSGLHGETPLEG